MWAGEAGRQAIPEGPVLSTSPGARPSRENAIWLFSFSVTPAAVLLRTHRLRGCMSRGTVLDGRHNSVDRLSKPETVSISMRSERDLQLD